MTSPEMSLRIVGTWTFLHEAAAAEVSEELRLLGEGTLEGSELDLRMDIVSEVDPVELDRTLKRLERRAALGVVGTGPADNSPRGTYKRYNAQGPHPALAGMPARLKRVVRAVLGRDVRGVRQGEVHLHKDDLPGFCEAYTKLETARQKALWVEVLWIRLDPGKNKVVPKKVRTPFERHLFDILDLDPEDPSVRVGIGMALRILRYPLRKSFGAPTLEETRLGVAKANEKLGRSRPGAKEDDHEIEALRFAQWMMSELCDAVWIGADDTLGLLDDTVLRLRDEARRYPTGSSAVARLRRTADFLSDQRPAVASSPEAAADRLQEHKDMIDHLL